MSSTHRVWNFNPGPAALPLEVLEQAKEELVDYEGRGMSLLEMSHRSGTVERLLEETRQLLQEALALPPDFRILFMGGGASSQFALVPLNLLEDGRVGGYILSGSFAEKAYQEALTVGASTVLASSREYGWSRLPAVNDLQLRADTAYVHMTTNNTIEGSQFQSLPDTGSIPLIGDMTSDILSRRIDWTKCSMFYAAAQKNLGAAGVTVIGIREKLLEACSERIPTIFRYGTYARHGSLYHTPPVHSIYLMKLMLEWTVRQGGVGEMEKRSAQKAGMIYDILDASGGFYAGVVETSSRSGMNITWRMRDESLEQRFVQEARRSGLEGLAGHRSVGGMRASVYNAVPIEACEALAGWMTDFQSRCR